MRSQAKFLPDRVFFFNILCLVLISFAGALLPFYNQGVAQTKEEIHASPDTVLAQTSYISARKLTGKAKYDSAMTLLNIAEPIFLDAEIYDQYVAVLCYKGVVHHHKNNPDSADFYFDKALNEGGRTLGEKHEKIAGVYHWIGIAHQKKGNYLTAINTHKKSLKIYQDYFKEDNVYVAASYNSLGVDHYYYGDYETAYTYFSKALEIREAQYGKNHPYVATMYHNIGVLLADLGYYDRAIELIQQSVEIDEELFGANSVKVAERYLSLARVYNFLGDADKILQIGQHALGILRAQSDKQLSNLAFTHMVLGNANKLTRNFTQALDHYSTARGLRIELYSGKDHSRLAEVYSQQGHTYYLQSDYDTSLTYFEAATSMYQQLHGEEFKLLPNIYNQTGQTLVELQRYDQAERLYGKSIQLGKKIFGDTHRDLIVGFRELAKVQWHKNEHQQALDLIEKAIASGYSTSALSHDVETPEGLISDKRHYLETLNMKAAILSDWAKEPSSISKSIQQKERALATFYASAELADNAISDLHGENSKLFLKEEIYPQYNASISLANDLYVTTDDSKYLEDAFFFAEKSRATVLGQALRETDAKSFGNIPDSLLEEEKRLRANVTFYENKHQLEAAKKKGQDKDKLELFRSKAFTFKQDYEKLITRFESEFPEYHKLKYDNRTAAVNDIQKALDKDQLLLEYFIGDETIYIFALDRDKLTVETLPRDESFAENFRGMTGSLRRVTQRQKFPQYSKQLYDWLIAPVEKRIAKKKRLVIIPDGPLAYIPFEALIRENPVAGGTRPDFGKLPYLLRTHEVSYHYSANLFLNSRNKLDEERQTQFAFGGYAPFADADEEVIKSEEGIFGEFFSMMRSGNQDFKLLKHSDEEVEDIIDAFDDHDDVARGFLSDRATEENFKRRAGQFRYLHLATHSFVNNEKPELSGVAFHPTDSTSSEDGILYASEIYNLDLNADLVVLSSCESGIGKLVKGEGVMALTRGLLYAGAPNVLVSLWSVLDEDTSVLMRQFYNTLLKKNGKRNARALREAKLAMLEDPATAAPHSWSSFVLIGE